MNWMFYFYIFKMPNWGNEKYCLILIPDDSYFLVNPDAVNTGASFVHVINWFLFFNNYIL